jgi:hypothetical protein
MLSSPQNGKGDKALPSFPEFGTLTYLLINRSHPYPYAYFLPPIPICNKERLLNVNSTISKLSYISAYHHPRLTFPIPTLFKLTIKKLNLIKKERIVSQ